MIYANSVDQFGSTFRSVFLGVISIHEADNQHFANPANLTNWIINLDQQKYCNKLIKSCYLYNH
jgi:hypothetical protein